MHQIAVFLDQDEANKWLEEHARYEIVDIQFEVPNLDDYRVMVWYKKEEKS